jgi:drug/metabolite transporter (DMT)-like permease
VGPYMAMALGLAAVSTAALFIRLSLDYVDPLAVAAWRLSLASLVLVPLTVASGARLPGNRGLLVLCGLAGAALAIHFMTWISSLNLTSVAASVTLVATYPLMVAFAAPWLLGERPSLLIYLAGFVGVAGVFLISLDGRDPLSGELGGNMLALAGACAAAVYFTLGRRARPKMALLPFICLVYGIGALILVPVALTTSGDVFPATATGYLWLGLLALVPQLIGHSSFNYALGVLPASFVTLVILGEPVLSTVLAVIFLDEVPGPWLYIGMPVLLSAIGLASLAEQRRLRVPAVTSGPDFPGRGAPLEPDSVTSHTG